MAGHNLFYFPYASLTDDQLPLLKVAALYFDKLFLPSPVASRRSASRSASPPTDFSPTART
jgi:hypothetical protein